MTAGNDHKYQFMLFDYGLEGHSWKLLKKGVAHRTRRIQFKTAVPNCSSNHQTGKSSLQEWTKLHRWLMVFDKT